MEGIYGEKKQMELKRRNPFSDHETLESSTAINENSLLISKLNALKSDSEKNELIMSEINESRTHLTEDGEENNNITKLFSWDIIKEISFLSLHITLFYLSSFLLQTINIAFIGNEFPDAAQKQYAIDAIGISNIYTNCSILSVLYGFISGLDILAANAYGASQYRLFGHYIHRAQLISYIAYVIFLIFHSLIALPILRLVNVKEEVLVYVGKYIYLVIASSFLPLQNCINFRYLNIIEKSKHSFVFLLITILLHPLWSYIFMTVLNLGVLGAAMAFTLSQLINCSMGSIYIYIIKPLPETIFMFDKYSFRGWGNYMKLSIPLTLLLCAEWWAFEILSIIGATLTQGDFTVQIFGVNVCLNLFTISFGFGISITIIVAREFGKGDINSVKRYLKVIYILGISTMFVFSLLTFFLRNVLFNLIINEPKLADKGSHVLILLSIILMLDIHQFCLSSFLKVVGLQWIVLGIFMFANYVIQIVLALVFTKVLDFGVEGIWIAILISEAVLAITFSIIYWRLDYTQITEETKKRIEEDQKIGLEEHEED